MMIKILALIKDFFYVGTFASQCIKLKNSQSFYYFGFFFMLVLFHHSALNWKANLTIITLEF